MSIPSTAANNEWLRRILYSLNNSGVDGMAELQDDNTLLRQILEAIDYAGTQQSLIGNVIVDGSYALTSPTAAQFYAANPPKDVAATWGSITGTLSNQTDLQNALDSASGSAVWGSITGTLSSQADLQTALDEKSTNLRGNLLFVDSINGNDATAARGTTKAFLTLEAARDDAISGDTIVVYPGSYSVSTTLSVTGVDWHFIAGSDVTLSAIDAPPIWGSGSYIVTGSGQFNVISEIVEESPSYINGCTVLSQDGDNITIECHSLSLAMTGIATTTLTEHSTIRQTGGILNVTFQALDFSSVAGAIESNAGINWVAGEMFIKGNKLTSADYGVWSKVVSNITDNAYVDITFIQGSSSAAASSSIDGSQAGMWIHASILDSGGGYAVYHGGIDRLYVTAQKIFGSIGTRGDSAGLFYLSLDKSSGSITLNGSAIKSWISIKHWDVAATVGTIFGGTTQLIGCDILGGNTGLEVAGGTLFLRNCRINTSSAASGNPLIKSGGTLILDNATLIAHSSRNSIEASTAQNVLVYSAVANKSVDADVTQQVGLVIVNSNVT